MQRYFIQPENFLEDKAIIRGDDAHHLVRVMRAAAGDQVIVTDGAAREALAEVAELNKENVLLRIVEERPMSGEPALEVWVAQSLPKGDKLETVIQKGTEVGAARFIPFVSARTVVQYDARKEAKRLERWRKIAKEAAEQAHRSRIPQVEEPASWKELLAMVPHTSLALFCYEKEGGLKLREAVRKAELGNLEAGAKAPVLVVIGPEGGFTEEEAEAAEQAGCAVVGLGSRILRTETAGLVALSCLMYESGELGH
ncbi:16S rRNA (uracil(1498)-N(3))-methyltransferase [Paenibacillus thermotolerans]|uniref:16S rRNA (uracil(1498)-N(3))-methyltransferase n=1 Tax=Paenibacillus thermotolerans TaxID=3027807 RepID=UPI0023688AFE|nr:MULTISPECIES: 16S rRNA (uracil(1498)-N(3))-methyltransferase [unclassified Paenibacillus]